MIGHHRIGFLYHKVEQYLLQGVPLRLLLTNEYMFQGFATVIGKALFCEAPLSSV